MDRPQAPFWIRARAGSLRSGASDRPFRVAEGPGTRSTTDRPKRRSTSVDGRLTASQAWSTPVEQNRTAFSTVENALRQPGCGGRDREGATEWSGNVLRSRCFGINRCAPTSNGWGRCAAGAGGSLNRLGGARWRGRVQHGHDQLEPTRDLTGLTDKLLSHYTTEEPQRFFLLLTNLYHLFHP